MLSWQVEPGFIPVAYFHSSLLSSTPRRTRKRDARMRPKYPLTDWNVFKDGRPRSIFRSREDQGDMHMRQHFTCHSINVTPPVIYNRYFGCLCVTVPVQGEENKVRPKLHQAVLQSSPNAGEKAMCLLSACLISLEEKLLNVPTHHPSPIILTYFMKAF